MTTDTLAGRNVSRETTQRLNSYVQMLEKWNTAVNLISKSTLDQIWSRHIVDSAQLFGHVGTAKHWADLGSGGGFPGLVVAIMAGEHASDLRVTLVESDQRKAAFLRHVGLTLGLSVDVIVDRIEAILPLNADVVSARALAPMPTLCGFAKMHLAPNGKAVFLKGKSADAEVAEARKHWNFSLESHVSLTDPSAVVLVLKGISNV